tara:strand:- start:647 stop:1312 length:666 start_codon:yes stop_codon:yes gene_type:complete
MDVKMKITFYFFIIFFISILIVGCKPDNLEIEIYTSDIESASDGEVVEVPLKATFRLMGEDKENQLPLAKEVALKYMPNDSEIEISKGNFGQVMTIVSSIPSGSDSVVKKFLQQNPRIAMVIVENGMVTLQPTETLSKLDNELSKINFMLGAEFPVGNTAFRIVSDSKGKVNVSATAVFSEKKPYLHFSKDIKKRKSVVIDFKGGNGSVYSEIALQFSVKF